MFCEHKSFLRNHSPRAMSPAALEKNPTAAAPCSSTLQWHQQSTRAHHFNCSTLKQNLEAAPCSGTSKPAPECAAPCTSTLCSTLKHHPCTTTSRLARQHPQAAPSKHCLKRAHHSDRSSLQHHPQAAPAAAALHPACNTLHQHLTPTAPACPPKLHTPF